MLNNLFAGILAFTDVLNSQILDPNQQRYLNLIETSIDKAGGITHAVLTILREDQEQLRPIDPIDCIHELIRLFRPNLERHIELVLSLPKERFPVLMRRSYLTQLMLNLVINARDAIQDKGKILVQAYYMPPSAPQDLIITVRDSGRGMTPNQCQQIFQPLITTKDKKQSTGMREGGDSDDNGQNGPYPIDCMSITA